MANIGQVFTLENDTADAKRRARAFDNIKRAIDVKGAKNIPHELDNYTCPITGLTANIKRFDDMERITIEVTERTTN